MEKKKKRNRRCGGTGPKITLNKVMEVVLEIKSDVNNIKTDVNNLKTDVNNLKTDVNNLRVEFNERVGNLEIEVKTLNKRMGSVETRVGKIEGQIKTLNKAVFKK